MKLEINVFQLILLAVLVAASVHAWRLRERTTARVGEIFLLYILIGYCGVPMVAVGIGALVSPDQMAAAFGFPTGSPFEAFFGWAYVGMSLLSLLALLYRSTYLIAPAVVWAIYFAGATVEHIKKHSQTGTMSHGGLLEILFTHGLISVLLVAALLMSGLLRQRSARVMQPA